MPISKEEMQLHTDLSENLALCLHCEHLSIAETKSCSVCGNALHQRKKDSYNRTLALTLAAFCFLFPTNYFPIMKTVSITTYENSTIIDGIFYFFEHGEFFVGTVILTASVFVPAFKIFTLFFLLHSVKTKSKWKRLQKNQLYTFIHLVGKWSMLDIFVMGMMIALVSFSGLAVVTIGYAALSFTIMIVLTLFAADSFDERLLWDTEIKDTNDNR